MTPQDQAKVKTQLQDIVQGLRSNIKDLIDAGAEHDVIDAVNNAAAIVDHKEKTYPTILLGSVSNLSNLARESALKSLGAHGASLGSFDYGRTGIDNSDK
jgi:hypothetical protein